MWADIGNILLGAVLLLFGTDSLGNGIAGLWARRTAESHAVAWAGVIAAAVVPALAVVIATSVLDRPELAVGSLFGAAIAQLGLMLGLAALIAPLLSRLRALAWLNAAVLVAIVLVGALSIDPVYSRLDGSILIVAFAVAAVFFLRIGGSERVAARALFAHAPRRFGVPMLLLRLVLGLALLGLGSWRLVVGGSAFATDLNWNPLIAGLILLGPAIALAGAPSALLAARRGHGDLAVGQAFSGTLAALLLLLGGLAIWQPLAASPSLIRVEIPGLLALAAAVYPMMRSDGALSRREGGVLLAAYLLFVVVEIWLTSA
ncbi:MAG TPA: sodium:calcium antiporter [Dokdonella sp.]|uniref:sodium:calcium antiporter n=1 Tax=Dokdonella sp. TaxID=2291710 RepID=UPI002BCD5A66|nr:sodium:calcium antiporter [Dokdonella sp.]HOX70705.1 sodium:calcium antiporter [Dokdonella sp.]HPG93826.1 sodium:calcium antiporter [Dokdonella sp.]HPN80177.1 sodium:calcium antiporter [Dokdonella sp.]